MVALGRRAAGPPLSRNSLGSAAREREPKATVWRIGRPKTRLGAKRGFVAALPLSVWVLVAGALFDGAPYRALGVGPWIAVAVYLLALPACGILAMLVAPVLWRSATGATVLGAVAAIPVYVAVMLTLPHTAPIKVALGMGVVLALLAGGAVGRSIWQDDHAGPAG